MSISTLLAFLAPLLNHQWLGLILVGHLPTFAYTMDNEIMGQNISTEACWSGANCGQTTHTPSRFLLPPRVKRIVLELGSNLDPVVAIGNEAMTIAFEPILSVAARLKANKNLRVVPVAVSSDGSSGLREMWTYNDNAVSSSLGTPAAAGQFWNNNPDRGDGESAIVATLALGTILQDLKHAGVEVALLKTDMQGADFGAVKSAGASVRQVAWLITEMWVDNLQTYNGLENDFCRNWWPHMIKLGFELRGLECSKFPSCGGLDLAEWSRDPNSCCQHNIAQYPEKKPGYKECDAVWMRLDGKPVERPPVEDSFWVSVWGGK